VYQRELFAERLLSAREQKQDAARLRSFGAVAVQLDLFCGVRRYVALTLTGELAVRNFAESAT
jgi:hypothetical protein